jgi:N-terminal domain of anti-restriction factor ArdC
MYMPRFNADVQQQRPQAKEEAPMKAKKSAPASSTTTNPVTPINENPKQPQPRQQPQTAREIIAANVKELIAQLEAGRSDALTAYLDAMSRFHNYSFGNVLEIARQKPDATRVAGFWKWKEFGRNVKKAEKGIRILAPIIGVERKPDAEAEKDITKQNTRKVVGFRNTYVFDVSQTEGAELPAMREVGGDVGENRDHLLSFIEHQGIELVFTERIAPALGISYGGRIAILPGQSKAEEFSTLVHELAHELLHKAERRTTTTKVVKETEAEAVAFVVGKAVGLKVGTASADYIHLYHGNASLLAESLEVVQQTSAVIIAALQPPTAEQAAMPDAELAKVA